MSLLEDVQAYVTHVNAGLVVIGSQTMASSKPKPGSVAISLAHHLSAPVLMVKVRLSARAQAAPCTVIHGCCGSGQRAQLGMRASCSVGIMTLQACM